ncbi:MAG: hypothetical protein GY953_25850 [bacterium]|nr:hypothetical protein [bacterium]
MPKEETQKVTVMLPASLVKRATAATRKGLTPTIRMGLERVASWPAYDKLRRMRGKVKLSIDVDELREDRN